MNVTLNPDGTTSREIIGSVAEGLRANSADAEMMTRFKQIFTDPSLQMISFTITEKGYGVAPADLERGLTPVLAMGKVTALLYERFKAGKLP